MSCCRLYGNSFRFTVTCLLRLGNAHQVFWKMNRHLTLQKVRNHMKSQQLQIPILSWWLSLFSSQFLDWSCAKCSDLHVILTVPWWPCCTSISQFHESMEAVNIPKRQLPIILLAFQDDECFMMYELAEGPTETFQNIPCVLSHVKSTLSIGISLVSQQPLGHGYYWTWPLPWGLILDLGPKVGEYEVHHLWIPRRWCTDALEWRSECCVVHYHFSLYLMFMRMYICVSIYII